MDCKETLCAGYRSIWYQLAKDSGGYAELDKIEAEFKESRASQTFNDWLEHSAKHLKILVMDAKHDKWHFYTRRKTASTPILLWAEILKSYLKFKHDTPSCVQLWKWAAHGHCEQTSTERELAHLNIRMEGKTMHIGTEYSTTKKTYDKLFEHHIGTQSIYPDSRQRKDEKFMQNWERRINETLKKKKFE
jgi:hypothetical protein